MAAGSLVLGRAADRAGRRATILGCLGVMVAGMLGAASARGVVGLSAWRLFTGIGIGGMLATTNAAVAEVSNAARRSLCVILMAAGYPLGTIVGGSVSAVLLRQFDWRAIFVFGASVTLAFVPVVVLAAPESIAFLMHRRPPAVLARINATLGRMGHPPVAVLAEAGDDGRAVPVAALFAPALRRSTILLTLAYLAQIITFYFILKWIPKIVVDLGFAPSAAAGVLVWASAGGLVGSVVVGLLSARVPVRRLALAAMVGSVVAVVVFGRSHGRLGDLDLVAAVAGCFTNAAMVGLYALVAQTFPTALRATATGFTIGIGRGGSALAPALAGALFAAGIGLPTVALIMATGSLIAAAALLGLRPAVPVAER